MAKSALCQAQHGKSSNPVRPKIRFSMAAPPIDTEFVAASLTRVLRYGRTPRDTTECQRKCKVYFGRVRSFDRKIKRDLSDKSLIDSTDDGVRVAILAKNFSSL
jgi:hypothetical protein